MVQFIAFLISYFYILSADSKSFINHFNVKTLYLFEIQAKFKILTLIKKKKKLINIFYIDK